MVRSGENLIDGVPVYVERKRIRRINIRVGADGCVRLSVPRYWATLAEGESFIRSKWSWVLAARERALSALAASPGPANGFEKRTLAAVLDELNRGWALRLGEGGVTWGIRQMKTLWGSCHWRKRKVVYSAELARAPRSLVEYVVVHELTHLRVHDHGPGFRALMDERLPDWRERRVRLNRRDFAASARIVQPELFPEAAP